MSLKIRSVSVNNQSIFNQLIFDVEIPYCTDYEYPILISGILSTVNGNTEIATLIEYRNDSEDIRINSMDNHSHNNQDNNAKFKLIADLSPKAIEHIENIREKHTPKDIEFKIELQVKYIRADYNCEAHKKQISEQQGTNATKGDQYNIPFIKFRFEQMQANYKIEQSDWIARFAEKLGIGKFLLLELNIPEIKKNNGETLNETHEILKKKIKLVENFIKKGEWYAAMTPLKEFYETFKNVELKNELKDLLKEDCHEDLGIDNFFKGIDSFYHFVCKYIHPLDQTKRTKAIPTANKEDVYLGYSLAISILNLISKKLVKKDENCK